MLVLYYNWSFFLFLIFCFRSIIDYAYNAYNQPVIKRRRDFDNLGFFEKIFLAFFKKDNWFYNSIANIYNESYLLEYRQKEYPRVFLFHLWFDEVSYFIKDLSVLSRQNLYFNNSYLFKKKTNFINRFFFKSVGYSQSTLIQFIILQKLLYEKYYNIFGSLFFKEYDSYNVIKLNWWFYLFVSCAKGRFIEFDLNKYVGWYKYYFNIENFNKYVGLNSIFIKSKIHSEFDEKRFLFIKKTYKYYNSTYRSFFKFLKNKYKNIFFNKFHIKQLSLIKLNLNWYEFFKNYYTVRYSESSVSKHIELNNLKLFNFFYIRKNRIFNKGRYSRNRQLYRTGVYWCLWLNVILVYGLYFMFYRFSFNFGYMWWGVLILTYSTIFSRVVKYNFFNIFYVFEEVQFFIKWVGCILINFNKFALNIFNTFLLKIDILSNYRYYFNSNFDLFLNSLFLNKLKFFYFRENFQQNENFTYFWCYLHQYKTTILNYKAFLNWFSQFHKALI